MAELLLPIGPSGDARQLILGAASNAIIIQNAETKYKLTITFWEFAKVGVPLTVANILVYWLFLQVV